MIDIELRGLDILRKRLKGIPGAAEWALMRTLNDVAISGRQVAVEDIVKRYNIGNKPVRGGMRIINANPGRLIAIIRVSGYRFPIQLFSPSRTETGVEFTEIRGRTSSIQHAFMAIMKFGPNVFARKGAGRGPVQKLTGLSIANMAREQKEVLPDIEARINEQLSKRAAFWMGEALAGRTGKYGERGGE
jgi:hypothetical protein